jgi:hypothetical protein
MDPLAVPKLSDGLALNYADATISLLRAKYNGARVAREVSQIAQVGFAAATGAAAAFNYGTHTIAWLGIGTAVVPELQRIIDAKGRAQVYQDAVRLIEEAEIEYLSFNQEPTNALTQNGVTLLQRTTASIHLVEKTLTGSLPTIEDLRKATEPMSSVGARRTGAGSIPANNTPADPAAGRGAAAREEARMARVQAALLRVPRESEAVSRAEIERMAKQRADQRFAEMETQRLGLPSTEQFGEKLAAVDAAIPADKKEAVYRAVFKNAKVDLSVPELARLKNVGFNFITLNEVYARFPGKQVQINHDITKLQSRPAEPPLPEL